MVASILTLEFHYYAELLGVLGGVLLISASGIQNILRIFISQCTGLSEGIYVEVRIRLSILCVLRSYVCFDSPPHKKVRV